MNGNSTTVLSAPTTGTYKGILFFGDRTGTGTNKINGTNSSLLTGATYFPSQAVQYLGNFSGQGGCGQVIGDTVDWTGSTTVAVDCSAYGMSTIAAYTIVKLVE